MEKYVIDGCKKLTVLMLLSFGAACSSSWATTNAEAYSDCLGYQKTFVILFGAGEQCVLGVNPFSTVGAYSYGYYTPWYGTFYSRTIDQYAGVVPDDLTKAGGASSLCGVENVFVTDPINPLNGNEYFVDNDYEGGRGLVFRRFYNSVVGSWTYSYSRNIYIKSTRIDLISDDGEKVSFNLVGGSWVGPKGGGSLTATGSGWKIVSNGNESSYFNSLGQLTKISSPYNEVSLSYSSWYSTVTITSSLGDSATLVTDNTNGYVALKSAVFPGVTFTYQTDAKAFFTGVTKTRGTSVLNKTYLYEKPGKPRLLTGVIDERGIRYATWDYDDQDRATFSETAGIGAVSISYNNDGSSVVTNELGKKIEYQTVSYDGVRRVSSVNGEPSPNCPASNSSYTYSPEGQILTKTDALGIVTSYTYNDRGLEVSREEASGTSLTRMVKTEWDPSLPLPTKITESEHTAIYTYDDKGRALSRMVKGN